MIFKSTFPLLRKVEQNPLLEKVEQNPLLEKVEQNSIRFGLKGVILINKLKKIFFSPPRGLKNLSYTFLLATGPEGKPP
jgi:hypothetical protein